MSPFALPKNCIGLDATPAEAKSVKEQFMPWLASFANAQPGSITVTATESTVVQSFTAYKLEGMSVWVLLNNWSSVIGAIGSEPKAGFAYAVDVPFLDLAVPEFLQGWGPAVPAASELNAPLIEDSWNQLAASDQSYADKFKPTTIGHVLFNYWD